MGHNSGTHDRVRLIRERLRKKLSSHGDATCVQVYLETNHKGAPHCAKDQTMYLLWERDKIQSVQE